MPLFSKEKCLHIIRCCLKITGRYNVIIRHFKIKRFCNTHYRNGFQSFFKADLVWHHKWRQKKYKVIISSVKGVSFKQFDENRIFKLWPNVTQWHMWCILTSCAHCKATTITVHHYGLSCYESGFNSSWLSLRQLSSSWNWVPVVRAKYVYVVDTAIFTAQNRACKEDLWSTGRNWWLFRLKLVEHLENKAYAWFLQNNSNIWARL